MTAKVEKAKCIKEKGNWYAEGLVDGKKKKEPMGHVSGDKCTDKDAENRLHELYD